MSTGGADPGPRSRHARAPLSSRGTGTAPGLVIGATDPVHVDDIAGEDPVSSPTSHEVVVGRIGKAHGVRGEVSVEPRTDEPERRFADGAVLAARTPRGGDPQAAGRPASLTVLRTRWHRS